MSSTERPSPGERAMPHEGAARVYWNAGADTASRERHMVRVAELMEKAERTPQAKAFVDAFVASDLGPKTYESSEWPKCVYSFLDRNGDEVQASFDAGQGSQWDWSIRRHTQGADGVWYPAMGRLDGPVQYLSALERALACVEIALTEPLRPDRWVCKYTGGCLSCWVLVSVGPRRGSRVARFREVIGERLEPWSAFPFELDVGDLPHVRAGIAAINDAAVALAATRRAAGLVVPSEGAVRLVEFIPANNLGIHSPQEPSDGLHIVR